MDFIPSLGLGFLKSPGLQQKENGYTAGKKLPDNFAVAPLARTYGSFREFHSVRVRKDLGPGPSSHLQRFHCGICGVGGDEGDEGEMIFKKESWRFHRSFQVLYWESVDIKRASSHHRQTHVLLFFPSLPLSNTFLVLKLSGRPLADQLHLFNLFSHFEAHKQPLASRSFNTSSRKSFLFII